jgi:aspartyl-tRNA(Asn)/glutamyl-tRNA(Gln) amidotransferase subunit C
MPSRLGAEDVKKIAALARLELTPGEVELFTRQLADILNYVDELRAVDTTGIEPTSHPLATGPVWRDDQPQPSLDRELALKNAPGTSPRAGLFKVPKVL